MGDMKKWYKEPWMGKMGGEGKTCVVIKVREEDIEKVITRQDWVK